MKIVITSVGKRKDAQKLANALVKQGLAACVSFWPINSTYKWKGRLARESEFLVECKCKAANAGKAEKFIRESHPYELPMVYSFSPSHVFVKFRKWVDSQ